MLKPGSWLDLLGPGLKQANIKVTENFKEATWTLTHSHGVQLKLTIEFIQDISTDKLIDFITKWYASVQAALTLPISKPTTGDNLYPGKLFWSDPPHYEFTKEWAVDGFHVVDLDGMLVPEEFTQMIVKEEQELNSQSWHHSEYHEDDLYGSWSILEAWAKKVDDAIVGKQYDHIITDDLVMKNTSAEKVTYSFKELYDKIKSGQIKLPEPKKLDPLMKPPKSWFKF